MRPAKMAVARPRRLTKELTDLQQSKARVFRDIIIDEANCLIERAAPLQQWSLLR